MIFSFSDLDKPKSGHPGFCLNDPTAFTSKIGFLDISVFEPIGNLPISEFIRSNHSKIRGPLVAYVSFFLKPSHIPFLSLLDT